MGRNGPRADVSTTTNEPHIEFSDEQWLELEICLNDKLNVDQKEKIQRIFLQYGSSYYSADQSVLHSDLKRKIKEIHKTLEKLRKLLDYRGASSFGSAMSTYITRGFNDNVFDLKQAYFLEYVSDRDLFLPRVYGADEKHEMFLSFGSCFKFIEVLRASTDSAAIHMDRGASVGAGFSKTAPIRKLVRELRSWAKSNGISYSGRSGVQPVALVVFTAKAIRFLPKGCKPPKGYTESTIEQYFAETSSEK